MTVTFVTLCNVSVTSHQLAVLSGIKFYATKNLYIHVQNSQLFLEYYIDFFLKRHNSKGKFSENVKYIFHYERKFTFLLKIKVDQKYI